MFPRGTGAAEAVSDDLSDEEPQPQLEGGMALPVEDALRSVRLRFLSLKAAGHRSLVPAAVRMVHCISRLLLFLSSAITKGSALPEVEQIQLSAMLVRLGGKGEGGRNEK